MNAETTMLMIIFHGITIIHLQTMAVMRILRDIHVVPLNLEMKHVGCSCHQYAFVGGTGTVWQCGCHGRFLVIDHTGTEMMTGPVGCINIENAYHNELRRRRLEPLFVENTPLGCEPGLCRLVLDYNMEPNECRKYP